LIKSYLRTNGIARAGEISYLLKKTKALVSTGLQEMQLRGGLIQIDVITSSIIPYLMLLSY